mgnify:CR=1 FL=1
MVYTGFTVVSVYCVWLQLLSQRGADIEIINTLIYNSQALCNSLHWYSLMNYLMNYLIYEETLGAGLYAGVG